MRFNRMLKDRQEIMVLGELLLFLAAWGLGVAAAVDDYRVRTNANARNNVASKADDVGSSEASPDSADPSQSRPDQEFSGEGFSGQGFSGQDLWRDDFSGMRRTFE